MIAIGLRYQEALNADPKAIKQISFTGNIDREGLSTMLFIFEEGKGTILDFSQRIVRVL